MKEDKFQEYFLEGRRPYLWLSAAIAALYAKSLFFGYTYLDDNVLILGNQAFLGDVSNILTAFSRKVFEASHLPYYRPMLIVSFILDAQLGGAAPFIYHLTNVAYHIAASCLVFLMLTRLGYTKWISYCFAMIFAVHPVLSQGVAWIPGRNDTMLAVFVLASFIFFLNLLRSGSAKDYIAHLLMFLAALFTKETAVMLPLVCALYLYAVKKARVFSAVTQAMLAGWTVCFFIWLIPRQAAVAGSAELTIVEAASLIWTYIPAAWQFLGKIFFPFNLSVFPIIQDTSNLYGAAAIALLIVAVIRTRKARYRMILFGAAWAAAFVLPSLIRANYRISADFIEHRVYLSIAGVFIMMLETDLVRKAKKITLIYLATMITATFALLTFVHIDNFASRLAFWSNAVSTSPDSPFAHLAIGQAYYEEGRLADAEAEFRKCLALDPLEPASLFGLGQICTKRGDSDGALAFFKKTIAVYPYFENAHIEAGAVCYKQGKFGDAERYWLKAAEINPGNIMAAKFLTIFYYEQKDFNKAMFYAGKLRGLGVEPSSGFMRSIGAE